ncbi:MAG: amino acid ABC transporter substrate-binding protein [Gammaproteobacteria bacterium]|nr:amino acid ABC transporter substrate-binding protein [Gammaproteobacteria bacterium]MDE0259461.1 amino acid ABC transporter substrate-binding protein [Gammaproteobacteria bacterium]
MPNTRDLAVLWVMLMSTAGCRDAVAPSDEPGPITIAATVSETGIRTRSAGEMGRGYRLAVEMLNEMGGVGGRQIRLVTLDDASDPATAARLYEAFTAADSIDALLGPFGSPITEAVLAVTEAAGWPLIAPLASAPGIWSERDRRWSVQMLDPGPMRFRGMVELAARSGARTVALVYEESTFPVSLAEGIRAAASSHALTIVLDRSYPVGGADHAGLAAAARDASGDLFVGGGYYDDAVGFTEAMAATGYTPFTASLSLGPADPRFVEDVGALARCIAGPTTWTPAVRTSGFIADSETFVRRYQQAHESLPGYHAAGGFGAVELLAEAVEATLTAAGEIDHAAVRDYLFSASTETVLGPYAVYSPGTEQAGGQRALATLQVQWQDDGSGSLVQRIIHPESAAEAEPCFLR